MHSPLLAVLLLASPAATAPVQEQSDASAYFQVNRKNAVAASLIPAITRNENPQAPELQWLLAVPHEVRSSLINALAAPDEKSQIARDAALMLILKQDRVANFRARAASGLSPNHSQQTRDALVAALKDADHSVRLMACQSLMYSDDHSVAKSVLPLLEDRDLPTRYVAARTLGRLDAKEALPALRELYQNSDPQANRVTNLAEAFSRLGDEEMALKAITPLLDSTNWNVRHSVHLSLRRLQSKQVVPLLIRTLETEMLRELDENRQHGFALPTRTMRGVCEQLDDRTKQAIGVDPKAWMTWWSRHAAEYGVAESEIGAGEGFDALCARYALVVRHGFEPGLPQPFTGRFWLAKTDGKVETEQAAGWSDTVNGVRLRLLAPAEIRREGDSRQNVLVQNTTDKPLVMPPFSLPSTVDYERGPKRDGERKTLETRWELPPRGTTMLSVTFKRRSGGQRVVRALDSLATIEDTIVLPTSVEAGRYDLVFIFDSAPANEARDQVADGGSLPWTGRLVSPPVAVQLTD